MKDVLLILVGVILGVVVKGFVDPVLTKRARGVERGEKWLENAMDHADGVLSHIQSVRSDVTSALRFDGDAIARTILRSLTAEFGPDPITDAARHKEAGAELEAFAAQASEAWMATRVARMDDEHGAEPADVIYEPLYALQWYSTALGNFSSAARRRLGGT